MAASSAETKGSALSHWYEGPVRYLITRREEKEFRALKDDASRSEFIHQFWKRRDPIPETPENEARLIFWKRVVEANANFHDSALPGWKTDRGKIHILVGPPTDIEELPDFKINERSGAATGVIRWIYQGVLKGPAFSGTYIVPFVRGSDGSYHLSSSSRLASPAFNAITAQDRTSPDIARSGLLQRMEDHYAEPDDAFHQGDAEGPPTDFFTPLAPPTERCDPPTPPRPPRPVDGPPPSGLPPVSHGRKPFPPPPPPRFWANWPPRPPEVPRLHG